VAYDKIITIRSRLDKRIRYAVNHGKTKGLVTGINCLPERAYHEMMQTKERWDKKNGVQGYHIIHSFAPGEVTPEQAQRLGTEFANRLLGERFEAVVATHRDHEHIHCHIVFNSVSFMDGKMYRSDFKAYFGDIRGLSNEISRENKLSVTEPKGRGKHYAEWSAEQDGKATVRGLICEDMNRAISEGFTLKSVFDILEKQGYEVKRGPNIKHTAVRPPGGSRFIRLESLGADYTEEAIRNRLNTVTEPVSPNTYKVYRVKYRKAARKRKRLRGFQALYVRYLYILGLRKPGRYVRKVPFETRKEVTKLEKYAEQFTLLRKYDIADAKEPSILVGALQSDMKALTAERKIFYKFKRRGEDVQSEISRINSALRLLRRELRLCRQIGETVPRLQEETEQFRNATQQRQVETLKGRSDDRWKSAER